MEPHESKEGKNPAVDAVQREVMGAISPDGRPPDPATARAEWRWFLFVVIPLGIGGVVALFVKFGAAAGTLVGLLGAGYLVLTFPVWGAGLMRGKEERQARQVAEREVMRDSFKHQ